MKETIQRNVECCVDHTKKSLYLGRSLKSLVHLFNCQNIHICASLNIAGSIMEGSADWHVHVGARGREDLLVVYDHELVG